MKHIFFLTIFFMLSSLAFAQEKADGTAANEKSRQKEKKELKRGEIPKELKEKLKITDVEKLEFKEVLKNSKGEMAKIWNSLCEYEKVIDAKNIFCIEQSDFLPASAYSFPGAPTFASINLVKGEFQALQYGPVMQLLVDLGDVNPNQINKDTKEVEQLSSFRLPENNGKTTSVSNGFEFQNLKITDIQPATLNHTYLLRSVIYTNTQAGQITIEGKRETIYSFRFIKQKDNIVTILWKKLR